ncbi:unnamed protein product [Schistosoma margrebowiei]|uniref:Uncharacterized protein n=1 Tax=Schistosoma margrebowiei TaxID=48269 RepID=A0A3P7W6C9_9TREM|nr:unnamed protein product [Schistosoma margrebowiei]
MGHAFRPIWDSSAGYTCISELIFTLRLKPNIIRFKLHHVMVFLLLIFETEFNQ